MNKRAPSARLRAKIGVELRVLRQSIGKTQQEVADATDMNQSHLSEVERGLLNITLDTLVVLAAAVGQEPAIRFVPYGSLNPKRRAASRKTKTDL